MMTHMKEPASQSASSSSSLGGKVVVLGIFIVALIAATSGLAYKYFASREPLEMWGSTGIQLIQSAPQVELLTLSSDPKATKDISKAQGLIHHRHFLTEYVSYVDQPVPANESRAWQYAVRFRAADGKQVTVLFDLKNRVLGNQDSKKEVHVIDKIAENWQRFIERQLAEEPRTK